MEDLLDQIQSSLKSHYYYLSLFVALAVPDIAGAIGSENGESSRLKYVTWYEKWVRSRFQEQLLAQRPEFRRSGVIVENPLTGEDCYFFRCSLLHQGSLQNPKSNFDRIIFVEPGATTHTLHYNKLNGALNIDLNLFCSEVVSGGRLWLQTAQSDRRYLRNHHRFARRHPNGMSPYIRGVPVIG